MWRNIIKFNDKKFSEITQSHKWQYLSNFTHKEEDIEDSGEMVKWKEQETYLSAHLDSNCMSDITILEVHQLSEAGNFHEKSWLVSDG
jgi:hypothetical protein